MFSYYGTKKKLSSNYRKPEYDTLIEPFCGAAMYSLHGNNYEKNVILFDKFEKVVKVWEYLIEATKNDIKNLPDLKAGDKIDDITTLSEGEKYLLGFWANPASAVPKKTVSERGGKSWQRFKEYTIENVEKVNHWRVYNNSYLEIDDIIGNIEATWFIDPPYQSGGIYYHSSCTNDKIDYKNLSEWCKERNGQVIVCENDKSDWLPFQPLAELNGQRHKTLEVVWYNN